MREGEMIEMGRGRGDRGEREKREGERGREGYI